MFGILDEAPLQNAPLYPSQVLHPGILPDVVSLELGGVFTTCRFFLTRGSTTWRKAFQNVWVDVHIASHPIHYLINKSNTVSALMTHLVAVVHTGGWHVTSTYK